MQKTTESCPGCGTPHFPGENKGQMDGLRKFIEVVSCNAEALIDDLRLGGSTPTEGQKVRLACMAALYSLHMSIHRSNPNTQGPEIRYLSRIHAKEVELVLDEIILFIASKKEGKELIQ